jgi:DNA-binding NarL/FixJ family response regulator
VTDALFAYHPPRLTLVVDTSRSGSSAATLTSLECAVLALMADGLTTRAVAVELCYSERAVKNVLQAVTTRLHLRNRTQAVAYAIRKGWI